MTNHIDMSAFIVAKSDQLNSDDLGSGPRTIRITGVRANPDSAEQPVSISYEGDEGKPFKPCKTVRRILVAVWGPQAGEYVGRSMTLYRDPKVSFGGMQVGGIRVSHMSHMDREIVVAANSTRGKKAAHKILPLKVEAVQQEDGAAKWLGSVLRHLPKIDSLEALEAFRDERQTRIDELREKRPELHAELTGAFNTREQELTAPAAQDGE